MHLLESNKPHLHHPYEPPAPVAREVDYLLDNRTTKIHSKIKETLKERRLLFLIRYRGSRRLVLGCFYSKLLFRKCSSASAALRFLYDGGSGSCPPCVTCVLSYTVTTPLPPCGCVWSWMERADLSWVRYGATFEEGPPLSLFFRSCAKLPLL